MQHMAGSAKWQKQAGYYSQEKRQNKWKHLSLEHTFLPFLRQRVDILYDSVETHKVDTH